MSDLSIPEAARRLGVPYATLDGWVRDGQVEITWDGGIRRITEEALTRLQVAKEQERIRGEIERKRRAKCPKCKAEPLAWTAEGKVCGACGHVAFRPARLLPPPP